MNTIYTGDGGPVTAESRNPTEDNKQLMNTNTNTNSDAFTRLLDDLLWLHARGNPDDGLREAVEAMIADYTDDPGRYSDGSEVWDWYEEFPGYYFKTKGELHLPPHRRTSDTKSYRYGT